MAISLMLGSDTRILSKLSSFWSDKTIFVYQKLLAYRKFCVLLEGLIILVSK